MSFAARPMIRTGGFASMGMSPSFSASAASGTGSGSFPSWTWTIGADGTITRTLQFSPVTSDTYPTSWGLPAVAGEGANWEVSFQLSSGSISTSGGGSASINLLTDSGGAGGVVITANGAVPAQSTPWYPLSGSRLISGTVGGTVLGAAASLNFAGNLYIRNKLTQQIVSQSASMNLTL